MIVESTAAAFRTEWNLDASVKIAAGNSNNLGRDDEINIYDASNTLVDRLTYGDDIAFPGSIRTQGRSGVPPSCQVLGANSVGAWVFSQEGVDGAKKSRVGRHRFAGHHTIWHQRLRAGHDRGRRWQRQHLAMPARSAVPAQRRLLPPTRRSGRAARR